MSAAQLITGATQVAFLVIFLVSAARAIRRPLRPNIDAALFFGAAATLILEGLVLSRLNFRPVLVIAISGGLLLSLPYFLLRLLDDYAGVRSWLLRLAEAGLVLCVLALLLLPLNNRSVWLLGFLAYFVFFSLYTGVRFALIAARTPGAARGRMLSVAGGSMCLGLTILIGSLAAPLPAAAPVLGPVGQAFGLLAGILYFLGFSPPAVVRRVWQEPQLVAYLRALAGGSGATNIGAVCRELEQRITEALGADGASIGLLDRARNSILFPYPDGDRVVDLSQATTLSEVLTDGSCRLLVRRNAQPPANWPAEAQLVMIGPLFAGDRTLGAVIAYSNRVPMFADDDLGLFRVLADQAALAIASTERSAQLRNQAELLDLAHDAIYVRDPASSELTYWNQGAVEMLGWAAADALGKVSHDLLQTSFPDSRDDIEAAVLKTGRWEGEVVHTRQDGGEVVVASRWALQRDDAGEPSGILEINTDISAQKRALAALRTSNAELEEASRHKSQFLANMSHELRTPLNAILGFSEILIDERAGDYDLEERRRFLEMVNDSGRNLLALVNDILDLSKVEAGQMTLRMESVGVADVITLALETVKPLAANKTIELRSVADPALRINADPDKVRQMLLNLVSNAIKFTPEGGLVTVSGQLQGEWVELMVTDSGVGIAPEDQLRIFEEFHQVDSGPARSQQGTGLGLALTKRFAQLHGGGVRVESELGKGSRFVISLPALSSAEPVADAAEPTRSESLPQDSRPLVLVVEDHLPTAHLISTQLASGGYRTEVARDAHEALDKAKRLQPVAVTLDILLPGIDGWEVLRALKEDEATRDLPVIVVTVVENEALGRALGAVDYFVKPLSGRTLLQKLKSLTWTTKVKQRTVTVLAIDDEPAGLDLIEQALRPGGFQVLRASSGAEGIERAIAEQPDLILTDLQMPEVSGFDVVSALRSDPVTASIPILVLTARDLTEADKSILNRNVEAILQKDSAAAVELVAWVNEVSGRRLQDPAGAPG